MTTTYLSPTIQNELILLLSDKVKNIIVEEVSEAKYFAIMCDSTPDISHTDQMALIFRYVTIQNGIAQVKESFLNFFPLRCKTAAEISRSILNRLEVNNLDVMMCSGQGYDNASTMSGSHSGVQQTIKNINLKTLFVPRGNHTLNLAGVHAVRSSQLSERFFAVLEWLYAFFAASPYRWGVLLKHAPITLKRVIDTRWSAHRTALKALHAGFDEIMDALEELCKPSENLNTRGDAHGILEAI